MEQTMFLFKPTALAGAIALATSFLATAHAADNQTANNDQDVAPLDTIVVTASRTAEPIKNVPARIDVIDSKAIEQIPIAGLPYLLQQDASINMVQSGGYGQLSSIFLRGAESDHTLVLKDGVRLNSASSGTASLAFLDTSDIEKVEILKGPASVLYGSDAIAGVVQLISKIPQKNSAFLTTEYGENNTYKTIIGGDLASNGFYAQVRGQSLETDGTKVTDLSGNGIKSAGYDQKGFSTKVGVEKERFGISIDYSQNQGKSAYDSYNFDGSLISEDFQNQMINIKGHFNVLDTLSLNARLSQFNDDLDQNDPNYLGAFDFVHSKTQEAELYGKWQFTPSQNLLIGSTYRNLDGDVLSYGLPYKESIDSAGYYIQHQYNNNGLSTQVGARLEDNQKYGSHTVGQAAIRYQILPMTSIYANAGTAFKSPTLNELYAYQGNPNLKPEESTSYEIGLDQTLNHGLSTGFSLYHTDVDHLIATGSNNILTNINKATYEGGEVYLNWKQNDLFAKTSYSYVKATNKQTNTDLNRRPRQSFTVTVGLENQIYGLSTSLVAKSHSKDFADWPSTTLNNDPGYTTVNFNAYWNVLPYLKLFTNIENIGDVKYKTAYYGYGNYYVNGGRLATVGVTLSF
ncbi:TonB-dependent receptor [Acinetobacter sp. ANC 4633]|uniref:TonB-dependent receptor plug domain-containing protein n=1 Tax=Acinetobacter sp. ANC 4633 TaxID=2529845 RepID=UPI00103A0761|nr:TonB-dependent receptor [Acinetobacter sp. ANC 4633]TCB26318.1 TonB-dependent receptor [Acinetobacter sp. ANC 4633]